MIYHVPLKPFQEKFERSGMSFADLARALDWYELSGRPDGTRAARAIGCAKSTNGQGAQFVSSTVQEKTALALAEALRLDPWEVGL